MDAVTHTGAVGTVVTLRDLAFGYPGGDRAAVILQDLNLTVAHGEFIALVGKSGAGKSTLLRVIAGLVPHSAGSVEVEAAAGRQSRQMGFVFQDARVLPWRSVLRNVEHGLEGLGLGREERRCRAEEALSLVGLREFANRWPHQPVANASGSGLRVPLRCDRDCC